MTNLPTNTYYQNGILINGNHTSNNINDRVKQLEKKVNNLIEELINVNKRLDEFSNREINTKT